MPSGYGRVGSPDGPSEQPLIGVNNVPVSEPKNGYRRILKEAQERQQKYQRY